MQIRECLGFCQAEEDPGEVKIEREWKKDGLIGQEVSWSVGFGPRTQAYVLKPENATGTLPGIVALQAHSDFKYYGKEKIADGPEEPLPLISNFRQIPYGGRAYVNALAREGFVVLAHDVFLWGSRRFPLETMLEMVGREIVGLPLANQSPVTISEEIARYNTAAHFHEHVVSKYCNITWHQYGRSCCI